MAYGGEPGYAIEQQAKVYAMGMDVRNRELVPNLKAQRSELMNRVGKIDQLLALLEKHPEFVKMLDLTRELV